MHFRRVLALLLAIVLLGGVASSALLQKAGPGVDGMTAAAKDLLAALPDEQRKQASMGFDDPARVAWHFIPKPFEGPMARHGVTLKSMDEKSRAAAQRLLATGLSEAGYKLTQQTMEIEGILAKIEGPVPNRPFTRDPEMYYFTVFGTPGSAKWGWRCEGHHLSLNFVLEGQKLVSATPTFYGANPADVPEGDHKGLRLLARREDLARELLKTCSEDQKKVCWLDEKAPDDLRGGGVAQPDQTPAVGLAAGKMTADQKKLLRMLLEEYTVAMAPEIAQEWLSDVEKGGFDNVHFAWWGGPDRHQRHYYRVQGPMFLIEYNNTQNNANHVHSMWRNLKGDFGVPLAAAK